MQRMTDLQCARPVSVGFGETQATVDLGAGGLHATIPAPHLAGPPVEILGKLHPGATRCESDRFQALADDARLMGIAVCHVGPEDLETVSRACYTELFRLLGDRHAARVWHYVPAINASPDGLENYRVFNVGRRQAFDAHFGVDAERQMPAASAVGIPGQHFVMAFDAWVVPPTFLENPQQTPAYHYPTTYGPKSPSFARAASAGAHIYLSGTASIRGSETVHVGDSQGQFDVTATNLETLATALDYPSWSAVAAEPDFSMKVYLRHAESLATLQPLLAKRLGASAANTIILQADICRADLDLEIEASFRRRS